MKTNLANILRSYCDRYAPRGTKGRIFLDIIYIIFYSEDPLSIKLRYSSKLLKRILFEGATKDLIQEISLDQTPSTPTEYNLFFLSLLHTFSSGRNKSSCIPKDNADCDPALQGINFLKRSFTDFEKEISYHDVVEACAVLLAANGPKHRPTIAIVDFALGGGSNVYSVSLAKNLATCGHHVVHVRYHMWNKSVYLDFHGEEFTSLTLPEAATASLDMIFSSFSVDYIMVSQLVSWHNAIDVMKTIAASGLPYLILMHDFFLLCPKYVLLNPDSSFCALPQTKSICQNCMKTYQEYITVPMKRDERMYDIATWRENTKRFLESASAIVCFSSSTIQYLNQAYSGLKNIKLNEHYIPDSHIFQWSLRSYRENHRLKVACIGNFNTAKGADILRALAKSPAFQQMPVTIVILGAMDEAFETSNTSDDQFLIHGQYPREQLGELLESYEISAVLIPSIWPETFSYTTSEAILMGYPVLCLDLGAQAERVNKYQCGIAIAPPYIEGILRAFDRIIKNPTLISEMSERTRKYLPATYAQHYAVLEECVSEGKVMGRAC